MMQYLLVDLSVGRAYALHCKLTSFALQFAISNEMVCQARKSNALPARHKNRIVAPHVRIISFGVLFDLPVYKHTYFFITTESQIKLSSQ